MPEFYIKIARKIFFPNFGGARALPYPPSPTPMNGAFGAVFLCVYEPVMECAKSQFKTPSVARLENGRKTLVD